MKFFPWIVLFNIQLLFMFAVYWLIRPLLKKIKHPAPFGAFFSSICMGGFIFLTKNLLSDSFALFHLPWFSPQLHSPIAALAIENGTNWERILFNVWWIGAIVYACGMVLSQWAFRRRVFLNKRTCPKQIQTLAERVFREYLEKELMDKCKRDGRKPSNAEKEALSRKRMPRIILSDEILTPGVIFPPFPAVLLDKADYTEEELEALFFYSFGAIKLNRTNLYVLFFRIVCWFNPLIHTWGRITQENDAITYDHFLIAYKEDAARTQAHIHLLDALTTDERTDRHFLRIGSNQEQTLLRKNFLLNADLSRMKQIALIMVAALLVLFAMPNVVQLTMNAVNEQTLFAVLGTDKKTLYKTANSYAYELSSTEENGFLYGTSKITAKSNSDGIIEYIHLSYPADTASDLVETETRRLYDELCVRLGEPNLSKADNDIGNTLDGASYELLQLSEVEKSVSSIYTLNDYYIWSLQTIDGRNAALTLKFRSNSAHTDDESFDRLIADMVLKIETP